MAAEIPAILENRLKAIIPASGVIELEITECYAKFRTQILLSWFSLSVIAVKFTNGRNQSGEKLTMQ